MKELNVEGMVIAPNVVETIITIAASEVEGVAAVGAVASSGFLGIFGGKPAVKGVEVATNDQDLLEVTVKLDVLFGYSLPKIADDVRNAVADALQTQVGITVAKVDVYVENIKFAE